MTVYINFICDEAGCLTAQGVSFDDEKETYGDLLNAMRQIGWKFVGDKATCTKHLKETNDSEVP